MTGQNVYEVDLDRTATTPVTEGIHAFSVADIAEGESSKGNPMWTVKLACIDPAEAGKQVTLFLVLTDAARWKFEAFLDAVNAPKTGRATADKFIGRQLRAQITHEDYEGKPQPRIGEMWPITKAPVAPATPAVKPVAKATATPVAKAATPPAKSTKPAPPAGVVAEDDIPF